MLDDVTPVQAKQLAWRRGIGAVVIMAIIAAAGVRWGTLHGRPPTLDMWRSLVLDFGVCVFAVALMVAQKSRGQTVIAVTSVLIMLMSQLIGRL